MSIIITVYIYVIKKYQRTLVETTLHKPKIGCGLQIKFTKYLAVDVVVELLDKETLLS